MTIQEAILSNKLLSEFEGDSLKKVLLDRGLIASDQYDESSLKNVELVTADLYALLLVQPKLKEGSLSIEYDKSNLKNYIYQIAQKYDDDNLKSTFISKIEAINLW